jgi:hypothetical protein
VQVCLALSRSLVPLLYTRVALLYALDKAHAANCMLALFVTPIPEENVRYSHTGPSHLCSKDFRYCRCSNCVPQPTCHVAPWYLPHRDASQLRLPVAGPVPVNTCMVQTNQFSIHTTTTTTPQMLMAPPRNLSLSSRGQIPSTPHSCHPIPSFV